MGPSAGAAVTAPLLLAVATAAEGEPVLRRLGASETDAPWGRAWTLAQGDRRVVLVEHGVGKVNTAAGLTAALMRWRPTAVVQFGIGGAYVGSFLSVGMTAVAEAEVHADCGAGDGTAWQDLEALGLPLLAGPPARYNEMPTDLRLSRLLSAGADAPLLRFATSERVTASLDDGERLRQRLDVAVESMEGAAAAQVCLASGVPFAELRAVSNIVGERDRRAWDVPAAVRAATAAILAALPELAAAA